MIQKRIQFSLAIALLFAAALAGNAQTGTQTSDPSQLTIDRIFATGEFRSAFFGGFDWLKDDDSYAKLEPSAAIKDAFDLVSYSLDNNKREVLIPADKLIPAGAATPLGIEGYEWSADGR